jgi:hypothetical protein
MKISVLQKGILFSLLIITASCFTFYVLNWSEKGNIQFINIGIFLFGLVWTVISSNKELPDSSVKMLFNEGFKYFMLVTLVLSVFTLIFYRLNPQILEQVLKENELIIQKMGNKTPEEIKENNTKIADIFMPMMIMFTVIRYLLLGSISTLCMAFFIQMRKS